MKLSGRNALRIAIVAAGLGFLAWNQWRAHHAAEAEAMADQICVMTPVH